MNDLVSALVHLRPEALHARAGDAAKRQAGAAWELAACLVAVEKTESFRAFDCTSAVDYAERKLGLGPCKALELLRGGRVLARYAKLSAACRDGRLCWSKLREIARVVQPGTEEPWLAFAVAATTREVERAVAVAPAQFRREQAAVSARAAAQGGLTLTAAPAVRSEQGAGEHVGVQPTLPLDGAVAPAAAPSDAATAGVRAGLAPTMVSAEASSAVASCGAPGPGSAAARPVPPSAPVPPSFVKLEMYLTPDQFAIWDAALNRVRSEKSRHVAKEIALETLARHYLAGGDARTRANHPVVLRADPATGSTWYETGRGVLPASAEAVEDALAREKGTFVEVPDVAAQPEATPAAESTPHPEAAPVAEPESAHPSGTAPRSEVDQPLAEPPRPGKPLRKPIPAARRRAVLARANYRCERCRATARLEIDHVTAVCDGGADLDLQVLCHACHAHKHAEDFAADARYRAGRETAIARNEARRAQDASENVQDRAACNAPLQAAASG